RAGEANELRVALQQLLDRVLRDGGCREGDGHRKEERSHHESPRAKCTCMRRTFSEVKASAGKKSSSASSESVTSIGVPNTVVVLKNDSRPAPVWMRNGTMKASRGSVSSATPCGDG